jgi:hypothetical protein
MYLIFIVSHMKLILNFMKFLVIKFNLSNIKFLETFLIEFHLEQTLLIILMYL